MSEENDLARIVRSRYGTSSLSLDDQLKAAKSLAKENPLLFRAMLENLDSTDPDTFDMAVPQIRDGQTGLYQKRHFENVLLPRAIVDAKKQGLPLSYVFFDLDGLHSLNREYGQSTGDSAIDAVSNSYRSSEIKKGLDRLVADSLRTRKDDRTSNLGAEVEKRLNDRRTSNYNDFATKILTNGSVAGRIGGGEEFAIILYGCQEETALKPMERLLEKIRRFPMPGNSNLSVTASAGIAQYDSEMSIEELKRRAEIAMRYSKDNGGNRVTLFSQVPKDYEPIIKQRS